MILNRFKTLVILIYLVCSHMAVAGVEREVDWDDLIPSDNSIIEPFDDLNDEQMLVFIEILMVSEQLSAGEAVEEETMSQYEEYKKGLQEQGVDVEALIINDNIMAEKRGNKTLETNTQLNGKNIRMPGYMLPLEFDGKVVTEFLLVPYVGACIHTPPPPANQIVHVKSKQGFKPTSRYFSPVWVNGLMQIEGKRIDTNLIDGSVLIYSAYTMPDALVEPF